jgi:uncharacterized membrane protein
MTADVRRLAAWSLALLVVVVVGAAVAVAMGWPAQFGGGGDPDNVAGEALTRGTALSPPAAPVVVFLIALALAVRPGRAGKVGTVLLALVAIVFIIGGLGEAFAAPTPDVPRAALIVSGILASVLGAGVAVSAVRRLRHHRSP